ncbi:coatomer WD associated region-domain-containing protein [Kockovaella imperatae]|uniref:Coatomer subunit alpha n=1 Tax=Kockovaella imperatae TaxID=4999 RepID=A0A1Y1UJI7_9TREE|nr:coatomer WD associated region-domain-containing protein [Kockovaella imperatae]ORX38221.1 coatomer WD associated region-domain-containing protein [Kockovaella imperatae]
MQMLTKFESKSPRVKGIAFHPKSPLLAASLHNGTIQLWNYQMGTLVDRFEEHDGPVRAISFHPTQPIFVSGGDDYKIKLWNYKQRKCLFTLNGHLDYVRTVYFHREYPWIISASDDQTIRIWNWQARTCIAILTGHNHYIMCAQFHPWDDLVVSASMDLTVRVWDISGLRKKNQAHQAPMSFEEQLQRQNQGQADLFGNTDAVVKYVLEGHDRGVNWATFHPTLPLIVSCGDDRQVKLWRMSETKAWEVDSCRGHFNNVSMCLFHPRHELILSASEDKTIRVWDMTKRTAVQTFRRDQDRFWVLIAHPELNLFAAGHDNGLIVFKLERERPAFSLSGNQLFYVKDKVVRMADLSTGTNQGICSVRKLGSQWVQPKTLSYNPAERAVLVTSATENGQYELISLPKSAAPSAGDGKDVPSDGKKGNGSCAIFVARNRLAVLDKAGQNIEIRDLSNNLTKSVKCPVQTNEIFYGGTASLLLASATSVILFDIQQQKILAELNTPPVKYAVWSVDGNMVALLSKHTITIANKSLAQSALIHETIRIKSAAWDDSGVLVYTTLNHIKYALHQGDNGIIKTLDQPVYLTRIKGQVVHCLDRTAKPRTIPIDPTEYRFKLALVRKNYDEVLQIIRNSNLVGQSIIGYLQKKGYPEIALHFVQDQQTRFDLAIECGNLTVALEMARAVDREDVWERLGAAALKQGNHSIVETAYQKTRNFDKLSFLYLITGNVQKLSMMQNIATKRGDNMSRFQNSLYLGDIKARVAVLRETGQYPLAYYTAKTNGLDDTALDILEEAGMTEDDLPSPPQNAGHSSLAPPPVAFSQSESNWPIKNLGESFFDRALANGGADALGEVSAREMANGGEQLEAWGVDQPIDGEDDEPVDEDEGWDLDAEVVTAPEDEVEADEGGAGVEADLSEGVTAGVAEDEMWVKNSPLASDHAAAGAFESAMQLLNRQVAAVNFEPLKPLFMRAYENAHVSVPANPSLPPLVFNVRRNPETTELREVLPFSLYNLHDVKDSELAEASRFFSRGKFAESLAAYRAVLQKLLMVVVSSEQDAQEVKDLVTTCREYVIGLTMETERRRLLAEDPDNVTRNLELAAYFTHCKLQQSHVQLALRSAMSVFSKAGNQATAAVFARRLIEANPSDTKVITQARSVLAQGDRNPRDSHEITYDHFTPFEICPASLTPIYSGSPSIVSAYHGARYLPEYKNSIDVVDGVTQVGLPGSGLRSMV